MVSINAPWRARNPQAAFRGIQPIANVLITRNQVRLRITSFLVLPNRSGCSVTLRVFPQTARKKKLRMLIRKRVVILNAVLLFPSNDSPTLFDAAQVRITAR
jgi:hypothetical protein